MVISAFPSPRDDPEDNWLADQDPILTLFLIIFHFTCWHDTLSVLTFITPYATPHFLFIPTITSSCRCTIGRLSLSSHWTLFLPFVAQVYFAQYPFLLSKTDRVRRCLSTHHWHNRVMRVSVCRYNISISHLQYPWGFSRVSYITILLIFPFCPY